MIAEAATTTPDVIDSPLVIYVTIFGLVVAGLATSVPQIAKILGPIGRWWYDRGERARSRAQAKDDADILELQRQILNLEARLEASNKRERESRRYLTDHARWDRQAYALLQKHGEDIDPPPSLF